MDENWNIQKLLAATQAFLTRKKLEQPRLVAEILLAYVLKQDRMYLFSHFDEPIEEKERADYRAAILRFAKGEPVAYITGKKEFMSLEFTVSPAVLIPRPDTEVLVETALQLIEKHGYRKICDVGTGSGCIPVSLAHYAKTPVSLLAVDISLQALEVARKNADAQQVPITFQQGDLLSGLTETDAQSIELLTANLPYVPLEVYETLERNVRDFEPRVALTDEQDGLTLYRRLVEQAKTFLSPTGRMLFEIDPRQAQQLDFIVQAGFEYEIRPDLAGRSRVVVIKPAGLPDNEPIPTGTQHFRIDPKRPERSILQKAAAILRAGGLVAFPTETVYGLGASCWNEKALDEIFVVKGRPQESPLLAAVANREQLWEIVEAVPEKAEKLMKYFWPGPLSIILPAKKGLPKQLQNAAGGVGIRMPQSPAALELIELAGPISAPSANIHGRPSPTEGAHVMAELNGKIPAVLDAGRTEGGVESTILDLTVNPPKILRMGAVSREAIEAVLGSPVETAVKTETGYSLQFQVMACPTEENFERKREILRRFERPYGVLSFEQPDEDEKALFCGCQTPDDAEADWFTLLRQAEEAGIKVLLAHPFEPVQERFTEGLRARIWRTLRKESV